jgi:predicted transposase/invertase (TIGR01784 family)
MAFDNTCKFMAENFSTDIAEWLLGTAIPLTKLEPSELQVEPIRADSLILLASENLILHLEFQTDPVPEIPFRMADYRLRGHRRYPHMQMRQVVIYLRPTQSEKVYQTHFELPGMRHAGMRHEFEVLRLWEQPTEVFLNSPGLLPFAVLSQTQERENVLRAVAQRVETLPQKQAQSNIAAATAILAGLVLEKELIHRILRRDIMRESVIYQEIEAEAEARGEAKGEARGEARGLEEGRQAGERSLVLKLLTRRIGVVSSDLETAINRFSLSQLEALGEALLDFSSPDDLDQWMHSHS